MAHIHHCEVCNIPVAHCSDDACKEQGDHPNAVKHFCSIHHPDPEHHVEPKLPPNRNAPAPLGK